MIAAFYPPGTSAAGPSLKPIERGKIRLPPVEFPAIMPIPGQFSGQFNGYVECIIDITRCASAIVLLPVEAYFDGCEFLGQHSTRRDVIAPSLAVMRYAPGLLSIRVAMSGAEHDVLFGLT